ncbi:MAG: formate dehydrogenase subunit gamma [Maritimibacter sp.]
MPNTQPTPEAITALIDGELHREGPLLPILHALQETFGHVPDTAVSLIADKLNIGRAEVHGVMSFYHDFREVPAGRHVVKICRAEACQAQGGVALAEDMLAKLATEWHGTSDKGAVTLEPVYCLGLCANGPAAMVDDRLVAAATSERLMAEVSE